MKTSKIILSLFILIVLFAGSSLAQEIDVKTDSANTIASRVRIVMAGLDNNPNAIILATPTGNTPTINPHPIGAWYTNNKWHIFNTDHATLPIGATFKVQVFLNPDANHYLHVVVTANNQTVPRTALNHPELDFHPEAQVRIFQNHEPYTRNPLEAKVYYDTAARKWFIENVDGTTHLKANMAYNVVIGLPPSGTPIGMAPVSLAPQSTTSPTGNAGGDLSGTFPNPNVIGLQGKPISNTAPVVGDTLRWSGTAWEPYTPAANAIVNANQLIGRDIMTTAPTTGQVLKWGGGAWYPADDNVGTASTGGGSAPQVLHKTGYDKENLEEYLQQNNQSVVLNPLTQTITLQKKSQVLVNSLISTIGRGCFGCLSTSAKIQIIVSGAGNLNSIEFGVLPGKDILVPYSINNYPFTLNPGTYTISFKVTLDHGAPFNVTGRYSTILVFPLE